MDYISREAVVEYMRTEPNYCPNCGAKMELEVHE